MYRDSTKVKEAASFSTNPIILNITHKMEGFSFLRASNLVIAIGWI